MTKLTRRGFLKASTATAAVATLGTLSYQDWQKQAYASEGEADAEVQISSSTCNACSNKCGLEVFTKNGKLWKIKGSNIHPNSLGTLCARGHGFATNAYNDARLTSPLKKNEDGTFSEISWEQAYQEIGEKVKKIIAEDGPQALAITQDPRPSGKFYSKRFMNAFGSQNVYTHHATCNLSKLTAYAHTIKKEPKCDFNNADAVMFIGRSFGDGIKPSAMKNLANNVKRGLHIIMVDPRFNATAHMAKDWLAIRPGTDLALILAMSNVLVTEELYDKDFIENYTTGFDEFAEAVKDYTPEWAAEITTLPASKIKEVAEFMAEKAPKAFIEPSWRAAFGCSYYNSTETARATILFNALLGCYGKKGGMYYGDGVKFGKLEGPKFKKLPEPVAPQYGSDRFPLTPTGSGSSVVVAEGIEKGDIKGLFYYQSNPVMGYTNAEDFGKRLDMADLVVVIDVQMSETAMHAHYVLPDTTYIERMEVPSGTGTVADVRLQGIPKVHENTRPVDQIFTELAEACGIGEYFTFTVQDVIDAQIAPFPDEVKEKLLKEGIAKVPVENPKKPDGDPHFPNDDNKIHFADNVWLEGGLGRNIQWIETKYMPNPDIIDEFRLIAGKQSIHSHTMTTNIPHLIQITKDYNLDRVWINTKRAEALGIKEGDKIEISSEVSTTPAIAHVTERLHPDCIWTASHYGTKSPYLTEGAGLGISSMDHTPFHMEPFSGSNMSQENLVHVKKMEA